MDLLRHIAVVVLMGVTAAPAVAATESRQPQTIELFEAAVERLAAAGKFSGTVLIAKDDEVVFEKAYGLANRDTKAPNVMTTRFNVGSMGKMFTGVATMQLVEADKLCLDDKLINVLPNYPNKSVAGQITIRQILTHTSGLGDYLMKMMAAPGGHYKALADYQPLFVDDPLAHEPGTKFSYSNAGYMVLGLVSEALSQQTYFDYVQQRIFAPAGMSSTGYTKLSAQPRDGYATHYSALLSSDRAVELVDMPGEGGPAGGGYSTVGDLLKFARALRAHALLDPAATNRLLAGKVEVRAGSTQRYAFGFFDTDLEGLRLVGHGGGGPGINGELTLYRDSGYVIAVLANIDPPAASQVKRVFDGLLLEETGKLPRPSLSGNASFALAGHTDAHLVTVFGDFNGWQAFAHPMRRQGDRWSAALQLPPGQYQYRFYVDGEEITDPANPATKVAAGMLRQVSSVLTVK